MEQVILERIDTLIKQHEKLLQVMQEHIRDDQHNFDKIHEAYHDMIYGNGKPGLQLRLDRLEQDNNRRTWQLRTIWIALLAAAGGFIAQLWK